MPDYRLISGDSHINEPPDLWTSRLPKKFKDRAPRMQRFEEGDAWIIEGAIGPINFGLNACGGLPPEKQSPWAKFEDIRRGGWDPKERLKEQDMDGVDAEVLYSTPRPLNTIYWNNKDPEWHLACIQAYNNWLSEYCSYAPDRLSGVAVMPTIGADAAVKELQRTMKLPGMGSVVLGRWPNGSDNISDEDDKFFAAAQDAGVAVNIHVGFATEAPRAHSGSKINSVIVGGIRIMDVPVRIQELVYSLALDRFPNLIVPLVEVDCGWVPYIKEQLNDRFNRQNPRTRPQTKLLPSEYMERNFIYVYITDHFGVAQRHWIGTERIMWSSDYPHTGADWPHSWKTIQKDFAGVPADEKQAILADNAARVYHLPPAKATKRAVAKAGVR